MFKLIEQKIRKSFSDAALQYDLLSSLHKEIGRELSRKVINNDNADVILDVGMGTGWLTNRISFFLPEANIIGLDFAEGMVSEARKKWEDIQILQANAAEMPFKPQGFDIVISNLAYQWVADLNSAFKEVNRVLKPEGKVYLTLFGMNTFNELFESLEKTQDKNNPMIFKRLPSMEEIQNDVDDSGLTNLKCDYEVIKVHFSDMFELVKWIKDIGANVLNNDASIGKQWLTRANQYYQDNFNDRFGVTATFEVIWVDCIKK